MSVDVGTVVELVTSANRYGSLGSKPAGTVMTSARADDARTGVEAPIRMSATKRRARPRGIIICTLSIVTKSYW